MSLFGRARKTFRRLVKFLGPAWLVDETTAPFGEPVEHDERALWSMALVADAAAERLRLGVRYRFPGLGSADALAETGYARGVQRGPFESEEAFAARQIGWIDDWRMAGTAFGLLNHIRGFFSPHAVRLRLFTNRGDSYTIDRDGARSRLRDTGWDWDGDTARWSRFWIVVYPTTDTSPLPWAKQVKWGSGITWGETDTTWGTKARKGDVAGIREIIRRRKPAGTRCETIIYAFDDASFDPASPSTLPDGTWGKFSKVESGRYVRSRNETARYFHGTGP